MILNNGDSFTGKFLHGNPDGCGIYHWKASGDTFEGRFENGHMNGYGVYTWSSGREYRGHYKVKQHMFCWNIQTCEILLLYFVVSFILK